MCQRICLYLLLGLLTWQGSATAAEDYDFRVVIDVSGSMKQTDPQNLRVPALKLINGLIPAGSSAGVWIFGKYVDMAVKWGRVDDTWRRRADLGADKIHSNALLTNVESALARATMGWQKPDPDTRRILLLLTDGKVDVSKDPAKNAQSRDRVLGESLAALKQSGAEVHAIGLSDGTDEALLKQLALESGGSFTIAASAAELQKVFFKMFERASKPDPVAFDGNEFRIDGSVKEMTLLLFRQPGSQAALLIPPDSPVISAQQPRGSRWRSDAGYDLITVSNPAAGTWRIDAEMDPDNRLMVVTDLKLKVAGIPPFSSPDQLLEIGAELFNRDQKIRKNSFLRFVEFAVIHIDPEGTETSLAMTHTSDRQDKGRYLLPFEQKLVEGIHQFVVSADSRTFNRTKRIDLEVQWPVEVAVESQGQAGSYSLKLRAREAYLQPQDLVAEVRLVAPDGSRQPLEMLPSSGWLSASVETDQAGLYRAHVKVSARNRAGEMLDIDLGSFSMLGVYREPVAVAPEPAVTPTIEEIPAARQNTTNWRLVGIVVVAVNVFLMLLALVGWLLLRRKKAASEVLFEEEEEVSAGG